MGSSSVEELLVQSDYTTTRSSGYAHEDRINNTSTVSIIVYCRQGAAAQTFRLSTRQH